VHVCRHRCVVHFTGLSFKLFVDTYKSTYLQRRQEIEDQLQKIGAGLEKMEEALSCVSEMSSELAQKENVLAAENAKTDDALKLVCLIHLFMIVARRSHLYY